MRGRLLRAVVFFLLSCWVLPARAEPQVVLWVAGPSDVAVAQALAAHFHGGSVIQEVRPPIVSAEIAQQRLVGDVVVVAWLESTRSQRDLFWVTASERTLEQATIETSAAGDRTAALFLADAALVEEIRADQPPPVEPVHAAEERVAPEPGNWELSAQGAAEVGWAARPGRVEPSALALTLLGRRFTGGALRLGLGWRGVFERERSDQAVPYSYGLHGGVLEGQVVFARGRWLLGSHVRFEFDVVRSEARDSRAREPQRAFLPVGVVAGRVERRMGERWTLFSSFGAAFALRRLDVLADGQELLLVPTVTPTVGLGVSGLFWDW